MKITHNNQPLYDCNTSSCVHCEHTYIIPLFVALQLVNHKFKFFQNSLVNVKDIACFNKVLKHSTPQFYIPTFRVFHDFIHFLYGPGWIPIRTVSQILCHLGGPYKNIKSGFTLYLNYTVVERWHK